MPFGPKCLWQPENHLLAERALAALPLVRTHPKTMLRCVAVPAEQLVAVRKPLPPEPLVKADACEASGVSAALRGSGAALTGPITIDVIQGEKDWLIDP